MEFNFYTESLFNCSKDGIGILDGDNISKKNFSLISSVLDAIGTASAKAQGLKAVITTGLKFIGTDQRLFIKCEGKTVVGLLKMGKRKLFIRDELGSIKEITPLCVLDFYVHESQQRSGHGKVKFFIFNIKLFHRLFLQKC
jgi:alpha-tubulin N-acetyltransferase 1